MNIGADGVVLIKGLKDQIRRLEAELARLHQVIADYAWHKHTCMIGQFGGEAECSCGFNAARQRTPDAATDGKAE